MEDVHMLDAVRERNFDRIKELAEEDPENLTRFYNGLTPFDMATACGHEDVIDFLLELGVRFERECENFFSPMETAVHYGNCALVEKFYNLGSRTIAREKEGHTFTLLNHACGPGGNSDCVRMLHCLGLVDEEQHPSTTRNGDTPLHRAMFLGKTEIVATLLELFPHFLHTKNGVGQFPIHHASCERRASVINLSLEADPALLDCLDDQDAAPIHCAARGNARAMVLFFHLRGSDVYHIVPQPDTDLEERHPAKTCALYRKFMFIRSLAEVLMLCD